MHTAHLGKALPDIPAPHAASEDIDGCSCACVCVCLSACSQLSPHMWLMRARVLACMHADEPTSALDPVSTQKVENALKGSGVSLIWITHDTEQPYRVGGSMLELPTGRVLPLLPLHSPAALQPQ